MQFQDTRFAFRIWQIEPDSQWHETSKAQLPTPPHRWRRSGLELPWHVWDSASSGANRVHRLPPKIQIKPRGATSLVWYTRLQQFYVAPVDCAMPNIRQEMEKQPELDWTTLWFKELSDHHQFRRPGIYKFVQSGTQWKLNCECPPGFDEYLPRNIFRGEITGSPQTCHLVGDLSLILALHAMCPEEVSNVLPHIREYFYPGNKPAFEPTWTSNPPRWPARSKYGEFPAQFCNV